MQPSTWIYRLSQLPAITCAKHGTTLQEVERDHIRQILEDTALRIEGPQGAALGLKPSTLRSRMQKLGITKPSAVQYTPAEVRQRFMLRQDGIFSRANRRIICDTQC